MRCATNARLLPPSDDVPRWTVLGDPTEAALQVVALKAGLNLEAEARRSPCLCELPFESRRKRMSMVRQDQTAPVAHVKGAPKEVLALCTRIQMGSEERPLDDGLRAQVIAANDEYARRGLRVLAMARRSLADDAQLTGCRPSAYTAEGVERDLTFLGLVAMMDPPRPEVAEAVEKCHRAGIRVVMITGDYGLTAESIARRIGIVHGSQPRIVTGVDLEDA